MICFACGLPDVGETTWLTETDKPCKSFPCKCSAACDIIVPTHEVKPKLGTFGGVFCHAPQLKSMINLSWTWNIHKISWSTKEITVILQLAKILMQPEKAVEHESLFQRHRVTQLHTFALRRCLIQPQCLNVGHCAAPLEQSWGGVHRLMAFQS